MELAEFKNKLDNREFWGVSVEETWQAAYEWQTAANDGGAMAWSWDCGLKLDYDGAACSIAARFYPPHKSSAEYGKYHGTITVMVDDSLAAIHAHEIEATTLDELKEMAEEYVAEILAKIQQAIKSIF